MTYSEPHSDKTYERLMPLPGEKTAANLQGAAESEVDATADLESNELHATGETCATCGGAITAEQDVRRRLDGSFVHEECPAVRHAPPVGT